MTFRPGPLRASAALAAGFVAVRVVYRALFHGTDGSGPVLVALPQLRLPAPFAHVVLLGPITLDGLWDAALGALPIALTILAFGLVNSFVDLPRLIARGARFGPLSGVTRALAIAWATLPSLADAARAVRFAQRLRGERGGVRMLAPLLQRTLERAGAVAAALELRGFAGRPEEGDCLAPVTATRLEVGFGARGGVRVDVLSLRTGTLTLLSGPTGSGKSTLLRAIAGLHTHSDGGWLRGRLEVAGHERTAVPPRDLSRLVGVVLQHPREAFATERVRDEIGLALELRGVAPVIAEARVAEVAERVGITALLDRPTRGLSAGEATRVAIAAAIVEHPILLLVDEPLADLDADARERIVHLLDALAHEAGICVVVAEHRVEALEAVTDARLAIDGAEVREGRFDSVAPLPRSTPGSSHPRSLSERSKTKRLAVLQASGITVRHRDVTAVDDASLTLRAGELVVLAGPNGAGKSSLLAALALPPRKGAEGQVEAPGRVALVPDASDDLFVHDTVAAECARADRRAARTRGGAGMPTADRFARFIGLDADSPQLAARLAQHPRDLSVGERRCLALGVQLAADPAVLLVDEPTRGLDPAARALVVAALLSLAADGAAVLVASHEPDLRALADRVLVMRSGVLSASDAAADVFSIQSPQPAATADARRGPGDPAETRRAPAASAAAQTESRTRGRFDPAWGADRRTARGRHRRRLSLPPRAALTALIAANLIALGAFWWPLVAMALPEQAHAAVPVAALALAPLAALVVVATLDGTVRSAHMLALLGTLAAIGAAVRIASTGVGGVEAVFILLILAGRAFGARFALLLGMATIGLSSIVWGAIGPWTPFQMFACAWVGAVAGLLPRRLGWRAELVMLCAYAVVASYVFGLLMNLWFWPFAVGFGTDISYDPGAPVGTNLSSFLLYSLVTSTLSWDTLRAITSVVGILLVGRAVLTALRRAKPLTPASAPVEARVPVTVR